MLYKKLRNDVTRELRKSEAEYWKEQFRNATTSKEFWNVVNKLKREQKDHRIGPLKDDDGELLTDDTKKADLMNRYFTQIGQKLSKQLTMTSIQKMLATLAGLHQRVLSFNRTKTSFKNS